jgi:hypothetical protein
MERKSKDGYLNRRKYQGFWSVNKHTRKKIQNLRNHKTPTDNKYPKNV